MSGSWGNVHSDVKVLRKFTLWCQSLEENFDIKGFEQVSVIKRLWGNGHVHVNLWEQYDNASVHVFVPMIMQVYNYKLLPVTEFTFAVIQ